LELDVVTPRRERPPVPPARLSRPSAQPCSSAHWMYRARFSFPEDWGRILRAIDAAVGWRRRSCGNFATRERARGPTGRREPGYPRRKSAGASIRTLPWEREMDVLERMVRDGKITVYEVVQQASLDRLDQVLTMLKRHQPAADICTALLERIARAPLH